MPKTGRHYAWTIALTGTLVILACLGFGRFALGMLLPSMAASLGLTYSQIGFISTGNFIGYLVAVLVCSRIADRTGSRRLILAALALISASMLLIGQAGGFLTVLLLYIITGLGSGAANVPTMALVTAWFDRTVRGRAAGLVVIGSGFAIVIAGRLVPAINSAMGPDGWRTSWTVLAAGVGIIAGIAHLLLRDRPSEMGLEPLGSEGRPAMPAAQAAEGENQTPLTRNRAVALLGALYFLFGYTYVIYATFIVTALVKERGFSETLAGNFWSWVGLLSLFSGPVFGTLSDRIGRRAGLAVVFAFQAAAYLFVALPLPQPFLYLSIFCYGIVAWSIPSIMVAAVSEYVGTERALAAFGYITFIFGIGQITGPAVAGVLAERTGSFSSSFLMAAVLAVLAIALTNFLKRPSKSARE